ncbi:MAG: hypothetical protein LBV73_18850 [Paraburkholderia sp.]|jgi:hypothetical protein|nr:hypothetical protein [Paraburkholderia sp.]
MGSRGLRALRRGRRANGIPGERTACCARIVRIASYLKGLAMRIDQMLEANPDCGLREDSATQSAWTDECIIQLI